jgi:tRNA 2-thiouridine synthesizing protein B
MNGVKKILYLFGFNTRTGNQLLNVLLLIEEQLKLGNDISLVLIHDGVLGISQEGEIPPLMKKLLEKSIKIYAIGADIKARGIDPKTTLNNVTLIDYDDLVDLLIENPINVSWM